ncbi:hypothetical protein L2E82_47192 [Cichorium intybus]|uniref:Uncharacterized protein n=1 Tax=Cichorium intybus TaxID=13427 RepID=A0ACB8YV42_CICIN|nr:hypothetical protein L2E82_47192 [Cichorium intybus]
MVVRASFLVIGAILKLSYHPYSPKSNQASAQSVLGERQYKWKPATWNDERLQNNVLNFRILVEFPASKLGECLGHSTEVFLAVEDYQGIFKISWKTLK